MATPIEEISQRTQRAITVARGIRLVAEAQREQAIIDAEVAITKRDPAWSACSRAAMTAISRRNRETKRAARGRPEFLSIEEKVRRL
jgi:hypothetical protein